MKRWIMVVGVAGLLLGCSGKLVFKDTPEGNQRVENLDEAGSVHVSVIAITPWKEIQSKLRPNLQVDPKTLREQAVPVTFSMLDKYLDILRLQASLAPGTVKTTSTSTATTETGKDDLLKSITTTTKAPGDVRDTAVADALAAGSAPAAAVSGISAINSSLTARAMASFMQDIQAINSEVDSATKRTGFTPYLMRVQVSVMPRRRHLGYDVYSNLSFFAYSGAFNAATGKASLRAPTEGIPFIVPLLSSDAIETAQRSQSIEALRDVGVALDLIKGFGSAGISAGKQTDRQQALQGLDVNSVLTIGRLSDNTLRVRLGAAFDPGGGYAVHPRTNTISVLVFFPTNANQTRVVARNSWTHVVDGMLLERSDEGYKDKLRPIASQWKSLGLTIEKLEDIDDWTTEGNFGKFQEKLTGAMKELCNLNLDSALDAERKKNCGSQDSQGHPMHVLFEPGKEEELEWKSAYVWSHLLSVLPGSRFSTTVVDLPQLHPACPTRGQLVAYVEDEKGISVALRGGSELLASDLEAAMHWAYMKAPEKPNAADALAGAGKANAKTLKVKGTQPASVPIIQAKATRTGAFSALMASDVSVSEDRKLATIAFASSRIEPMPDGDATSLAPVALELRGCEPEKGSSLTVAGLTRLWPSDQMSQLYLLNARIPKKEKDDAKNDAAAVSITATTLNLLLAKDKKSATTTVTVDLGEKPKSSYALTVAGGVLSLAAPNANISKRTDGTFLVGASGPIDLHLTNLIANQTVDLELHPVDEKNKLGTAVKKLTLIARSPSG